MISSVSSSGSPRNTVENAVAQTRSQRRLERAASATPRPSGKPIGTQLRARAMVTTAPANKAEPQPPLAKDNSDRCSNMPEPSREIKPARRRRAHTERGAGVPEKKVQSQCPGPEGSIDIEGEVAAGDLFIGAVSDDLIQRLVEALTQGIVTLAHRDGGVGGGAVDVTNDLAAVLAGTLSPGHQRKLVGNHPVNSTGDKITVGFVQRRIE